ncbi:MAG: threonine synthase [Mariprofundaceae bacterium]
MIVTDGLVPPEFGLRFHPALLPWERYLLRCSQRWFLCKDKTALGWYAAILDVAPAALLAAKCKNIPASTKQCWVASPFHAQLGRDHVRVLPEGALPWTADDAGWLCELLNPLLKEKGMKLFLAGAALLLVCDESLDAQPVSFALVSGKLLPDRHPQGTDGGHMMRLLSEIQMCLHQHPAEHRRSRGEPDINGVWLWGASDFPVTMPQDASAIATHNPFLQSLGDAKSTDMIITESERIAELLGPEMELPKHIILAGEERAVWLTKSWLPGLGKKSWQPNISGAEEDLFGKIKVELQ